nr:GNAT family N-acetyltransferase [Alteriqipengyuania halimionae]
MTIRTQDGVTALDPARWDALAGDNPFTSYAFLSALEQSGSVGEGSGWQSLPIIAEDAKGALLGALPSYLKGHSQGEYVFDHQWADAWERAGGRFYPKLQIAAPFTPVNGPRVFSDDPAIALALLRAAETFCEQHGISSAHATFIAPRQRALFEEAGWLMRRDIQYHWFDRDYGDFDGFLAALSSRKRKNIRKERAQAIDSVTIRRLQGADIREEHWDAFWLFYQDTGARKWGSPYLTREAFSLIGETMADRIVLVLAEEDGRPVAGALNLFDSEALYGRYWGALVDRPFLHFEVCYYQAIEEALERCLGRVEAGAQGQHKLLRGYEPVETVSAHWISDDGFREAVAQFLAAEREAVAHERDALARHTPFKKG